MRLSLDAKPPRLGSVSLSLLLLLGAPPLAATNKKPTITALPNQRIREDEALGPLRFSVGDVETAPGDLKVQAFCNNLGLIPMANIVLGGEGGQRTLRLQPAANKSGRATIRLQVKDAQGACNSTQFSLVVKAVNDLPTISAIADQTLAANGMVLVPLVVKDVESPASSLRVSVHSSNSHLISAAGLSLRGGGFQSFPEHSTRKESVGVCPHPGAGRRPAGRGFQRFLWGAGHGPCPGPDSRF
jgi:hypothetical protein